MTKLQERFQRHFSTKQVSFHRTAQRILSGMAKPGH